MLLKSFLKLIRTNEIISIYSPLNNQYLQRETDKANVKKEYLNYKVVGVNTNFTYGDFTILEIDIVRQ